MRVERLAGQPESSGTVVTRPQPLRAATLPVNSRRLAAVAVTILFGAAVLLVLHGATSPSSPDRYVDSQAYRAGAEAVLHHRNPYDPVSAHGGFFTYPPLSAYLFTVLLPVGNTAAGTALAVLTVLAAVVIAYLCLSQAGDNGRRPRELLLGSVAIAAVCLPLQPITNNISFGQIGVLLACLVTVDLLTSSRLTRGILTGVVTAVKLTPAVFLVYLWVSGQRRAAVAGTVTAAGLTLAAAAVYPGASREYWGSTLWQTRRVGMSDGPRNRSLWGLSQRALPDRPAALAFVVVVGLFLSVWALWRARHRHRSGDDLGALTIIGCLTCLISPITWSHHLVWLVIALVLLVARRGRSMLLAPLVLWSVLPYPGLFAHTVVTQPNLQVITLAAVVLALPGAGAPVARLLASTEMRRPRDR